MGAKATYEPIPRLFALVPTLALLGTSVSAGGAGGAGEAGTPFESGGQGGIGGAIGGNCTPPIKTICKPSILLVERDTDDDGILDVWDDDDDNDGIPDVVECFSSTIAPLLNGSFEDPVIPGTPGTMPFLGSEVVGRVPVRCGSRGRERPSRTDSP